MSIILKFDHKINEYSINNTTEEQEAAPHPPKAYSVEGVEFTSLY